MTICRRSHRTAPFCTPKQDRGRWAAKTIASSIPEENPNVRIASTVQGGTRLKRGLHCQEETVRRKHNSIIADPIQSTHATKRQRGPNSPALGPERMPGGLFLSAIPGAASRSRTESKLSPSKSPILYWDSTCAMFTRKQYKAEDHAGSGQTKGRGCEAARPIALAAVIRRSKRVG